jgi:hypothetical protein
MKNLAYPRRSGDMLWEATTLRLADARHCSRLSLKIVLLYLARLMWVALTKSISIVGSSNAMS